VMPPQATGRRAVCLIGTARAIARREMAPDSLCSPDRMTGSTTVENVAYDTAEARQELLDDVAAAIEDLAAALAALGEAYENLDDHSADRLEEALFRPVQAAYGRAKRTHAGFAERHGLPTRTFADAVAGHPSQGVKGFIDTAVASAGRVDARLAELQDSMRPVDVGDAELRAGLSEVRRLIADVPRRASSLVRGLGR
jgi:hypothetical protein